MGGPNCVYRKENANNLFDSITSGSRFFPLGYKSHIGNLYFLELKSSEIKGFYVNFFANDPSSFPRLLRCASFVP